MNTREQPSMGVSVTVWPPEQGVDEPGQCVAGLPASGPLYGIKGNPGGAYAESDSDPDRYSGSNRLDEQTIDTGTQIVESLPNTGLPGMGEPGGGKTGGGRPGKPRKRSGSQ